MGVENIGITTCLLLAGTTGAFLACLYNSVCTKSKIYILHTWIQVYSPCTVRVAKAVSLPRKFLAVQLYRPLSSYCTSCTVSIPNVEMVLILFTEYFMESCTSDVLMMEVVTPETLVNVQSISWEGKANASQRKVALLPLLISNWS